MRCSSSTRKNWQLVIEDVSLVNRRDRHCSPNKRQTNKKQSRHYQLEEGAAWRSVVIDKVLAHERSEMSPALSHILL